MPSWGLGAQAIVSDLVSGFFILFEGVFLVGHRIRVGEGVEGTVEEIGVRITKIRDSYGVLHCIPNGEELRESCIWVRSVTRVRPGKDDEMQEALRLEVVKALAAAKIAPPHERRRVELVERGGG